jgi:hypothetical protein
MNFFHLHFFSIFFHSPLLIGDVKVGDVVKEVNEPSYIEAFHNYRIYSTIYKLTTNHK